MVTHHDVGEKPRIALRGVWAERPMWAGWEGVDGKDMCQEGGWVAEGRKSRYPGIPSTIREHWRKQGSVLSDCTG